jgi:hypothetical protein
MNQISAANTFAGAATRGRSAGAATCAARAFFWCHRREA